MVVGLLCGGLAGHVPLCQTLPGEHQGRHQLQLLLLLLLLALAGLATVVSPVHRQSLGRECAAQDELLPAALQPQRSVPLRCAAHAHGHRSGEGLYLAHDQLALGVMRVALAVGLRLGLLWG